MKFTFRMVEGGDDSLFDEVRRVAVETDSDALCDVLERFTDFLRGCGYSIEGLEVSDADEESRPAAQAEWV